MNHATPTALALTLALLTCAGCGPVVAPMATRTDEETQQQIDKAWDRIIDNADDVERQTLLDAVILGRLFEHGVDRLDFRSEKTVPRGSVVMDIRFDRHRPARNRFTVALFDNRGQLLRRESYTEDEIWRTMEDLWHVNRHLQPLEGEPDAFEKTERAKRLESLLGDLVD